MNIAAAHSQPTRRLVSEVVKPEIRNAEIGTSFFAIATFSCRLLVQSRRCLAIGIYSSGGGSNLVL